MKLKVGDPIWATCVRVQTGVFEELPGTVAHISTCVDCGDSIYFVRVPDMPCPMRISGAPPGCWMSSEKFLRPRGPGSSPAPAGAIAAGLWRPHGARLH